MAHNPQGPGPEGNYDPAGSTQMFRAFVDEQPQGGAGRQPAAPAKSGPGAGLIIGIVVAVVVIAAVAWLALG
ncbi:hypothetical protein GTW43_07765 [Streptomyces sp. SID5785]|uniref:hypothetical protein n=1 Tax=Streptomyces sp. SID5785 TaxID=2690309 RepID=UPI001361256A|nr:hypothetical protein [Streptomyces sp. SID5785]MZD04980.1 hypothetical protein [Streptomyces sp. SID5785]